MAEWDSPEYNRAEEIILGLEKQIAPIFRWADANTDINDDLGECPQWVYMRLRALYNEIREMTDIIREWHDAY